MRSRAGQGALCRFVCGPWGSSPGSQPHCPPTPRLPNGHVKWAGDAIAAHPCILAFGGDSGFYVPLVFMLVTIV